MPMEQTSGGSYASTILADAPRQYFQLDESSGPAAYDSSPSAESGSYAGPVVYGAAGPLRSETSTAISLPGGTASAGVQLPDPGITSGKSFSLEAWVYPASSQDYMTIWGYSGTHRLLLSSTGLLLTQFDGNYFSKHTLSRDAWHYVAFVYDAAAQSASYYIDGTLDSSTPIPASYATFRSPYYAGQYDTGSAYKWKGSLAQIAFYDTPLTSAQVANHYAAAGYTGASAPATPSPSPSPASSCGSFRWGVKTATDANAPSIQLSPQETTIASLVSIPAPQSLSDGTPRINGPETTVYEVDDVTLVEVFKEHDRDYHLLVRDAQGRTLIAEVPDPSCAPSSFLYDRISQVRQALDAQYPTLASGGSVTPGIPVSVQGAAFFDGEGITSGEAPNGIELHALTAICFGANCMGHDAQTPSPAPTPSPSPSSGTSVTGTVTYCAYYGSSGGFEIKTPSGQLQWVYGPQPYTAPVASGKTVSATGWYNSRGAFIANSLQVQ